jgi:hypothetical protein
MAGHQGRADGAGFEADARPQTTADVRNQVINFLRDW